MVPHKQQLRRIATCFGWTWYRMRRLIDAHLSAHGASMARLKLLAFLAEHPRRSTDIASFFDHAPRTVTEAIDWLEQNGLVARSPVPGDRRAKLVKVTQAGQTMLEQAQPLYDEIVQRTFGSLTPEELLGLDAAIAHLDRIAAEAEEEAGLRKGRAAVRRAGQRG
jgi:DNA-binding MarR family transcriptional regulator